MPAQAGISGGGAQCSVMALVQADPAIACGPTLPWDDGIKWAAFKQSCDTTDGQILAVTYNPDTNAIEHKSLIIKENNIVRVHP